MRFNLPISNLPRYCDGDNCDNEPFTIAHALNCRYGGHIIGRHNELVSLWASLCSKGFARSSLRFEPEIPPDASIGNGQAQEAIRGDLSVNAFWEVGRRTIFDLRITNLDNDTNINLDPKEALVRQEREKIRKYRRRSEHNRLTFTPIVFSVDGLPGPEDERSIKNLAGRLPKKWSAPKSKICFYIRSQLAVSLARSTSRCLRWARSSTNRFIPPANHWYEGALAHLGP